jgi:hypothetical protein
VTICQIKIVGGRAKKNLPIKIHGGEIDKNTFLLRRLR